MHNGCKVYMDSYMASNGSCIHAHLDNFQNPPLEGRPNRKPGYHGTPTVHSRWFILFYYVWGGPTWIESHYNSIWLRARLHMDSHYTWGFVIDHSTWVWRCVGTAFGHFSFGLSQFHGHGSWLVCEVALLASLTSMNGENRPLATYEPVEFEK